MSAKQRIEALEKRIGRGDQVHEVRIDWTLDGSMPIAPGDIVIDWDDMEDDQRGVTSQKTGTLSVENR